MQFNAPSRSALSGTTDSSRSFGGGGAVPVALRAHAQTLEKEKGKAVAPESPYNLEMPDIAKPVTFAVPEV